MNKDQAAGAFKDAMGKAQAKAGEILGNKRMQADGVMLQGAGRLQRANGKVKEAFSRSRHD